MSFGEMLFAGWDRLGRTLLVGLLGYLALLAMLRLAGKRTIGKMNVFDFVITVALGSTLANALLSDVSLAEACLAFAILVALQYGFSLLAIKSRRLDEIINGDPVLLLHDGRLLRETMRRERVSEEEVLAAIRAKGIGSVEDVAAVVLETDGIFSVIPADKRGVETSLVDVAGMYRPAAETAWAMVAERAEAPHTSPPA